jgi:hypothetical protein
MPIHLQIEMERNAWKEVWMKRLMSVALLLAGALCLQAQEIKVETRNMTEGLSGNQRFPVIAENVKGERIYTFRGGDRYSHYYYYKNGTWSGGERIPGSPQYDEYWFSDIVADSTGTFHYVCEDADRALYYGYFKDGAWASMSKINTRHEATLALGVRSDDTIVLVSALKTVSEGGLTKDVIIGTKPVGETEFSHFKNITHDRESSTMVDAVVDADDNTWIAYKGAFIKGGTETLQAVLLEEDKSNQEVYWKNVSGMEYPAWCWYPRVAVNGDGKIMVTWMTSQRKSYYSRLFDPFAKEWTEIQEITIGSTRPWPLMYNKILAQGSDFYWVGLTSSRIVVLYKYDEENDSWSKLADVSDAAANWCSASMGTDSILIPWDSSSEPTDCYLTTVSGVFSPIIRVQSVSNLVVEKKLERSFFHGSYLNALTWEANPLNAEKGITIAAHRVYRKVKTADSSQWAQIAALAADVYSFEDKNIASDSDYVYAVTCVDSNGAESSIVDSSEETSETTSVPGPKSSSVRAER